jgi:hypothetical protein
LNTNSVYIFFRIQYTTLVIYAGLYFHKYFE